MPLQSQPGQQPKHQLGLARAPSVQKRHSYATKPCRSSDDVFVSEDHGSGEKEILLSDHPNDELKVRGGTLRGLVEYGMTCFEVCNKELQVCNQQFLSVFFLMHEWITDSIALASAIIEICDANSQMIRRGLFMIRFWIQRYPSAFECNKALAKLVEAFFERVNARDLDDIVSSDDIRATAKHEWLRLDSLKKGRVNHENVSSLVFNQLEAEQLAAQLTVLEFKAFRRIRVVDLKNYAQSENLRDSPFLERSVALFNGLSQWVQCMILSKTTPAERARVVAKFLEVSEELRKVRNYNSLMSVIGGLNHSSIARLSKTHTCLSQKSQKMLLDFVEVLSSSNNFTNYRREYAEVHDFKIPILAVHLKDLIQLNVAVPDRISNDRFINFRKVAQLAQTIGLLIDAQGTPMIIEENPNLCNTLRLSLDCHYTEDDIYEVSLLREPRSLASPSTPTKPVGFAQWVSGSKPPHPETLKRHIFDMVEAVFKVYDNDKDEMISESEFEQIAENFPFIDTFAVLDTDNDGMISKAELKNYFIRANSHALKNSFKHDFHETSYFKPTFCDRCAGLLWGLIKQGWKCRDCGINVHKHCKDTVVMECRAARHHGGHRRNSGVECTTGGGANPGSSGQAAPQADNGQSAGPVVATQEPPAIGVKCPTPPPSTQPPPPTQSPPLPPPPQHTQPPALSIAATEERSVQTEASGLCCQAARDEADRLTAENAQLQEEAARLRQQTQSQAACIARLRAQIFSMRQQTLSFILRQMDALQIQRNSEV